MGVLAPGHLFCSCGLAFVGERFSRVFLFSSRASARYCPRSVDVWRPHLSVASTSKTFKQTVNRVSEVCSKVHIILNAVLRSSRSYPCSFFMSSSCHFQGHSFVAIFRASAAFFSNFQGDLSHRPFLRLSSDGWNFLFFFFFEANLMKLMNDPARGEALQ